MVGIDVLVRFGDRTLPPGHAFTVDIDMEVGPHMHEFEEKYVVFKKEDLEIAIGHSGLDMNDPKVETILEEMKRVQLDNFAVIRLGDLFAPSGLFAYANAIQNGMEIVQELSSQIGASVSPELTEHLENIRDYFYGKGQLSQSMDRKLPD